MRVEHFLPSGVLGRRPVRILVVGAGGTGSAIVMGLPYLHQAMRAWGHRLWPRSHPHGWRHGFRDQLRSAAVLLVGCGPEQGDRPHQPHQPVLGNEVECPAQCASMRQHFDRISDRIRTS